MFKLGSTFEKISIINHINKLKKTNYVFTSIDADRPLTKSNTHHNKNSQYIKNRGKFPPLDKEHLLKTYS